MLRLSVVRSFVTALILFYSLLDSQNISCYRSNNLLCTAVACQIVCSVSFPVYMYNIFIFTTLALLFIWLLHFGCLKFFAVYFLCVTMHSRLPSRIFDFHAILSQIFLLLYLFVIVLLLWSAFVM